jgi:acyl-CoA reductase-like NAD-dependent aldehyde dehydrogenase
MIIGDPMDEATQVGPMVSWAQRDKVLSYIEKGKAEGATLMIRRRHPQQRLRLKATTSSRPSLPMSPTR